MTQQTKDIWLGLAWAVAIMVAIILTTGEWML